MSDLIEEIKQDIHEERVRHLWKTYGGWVIAFAVLIVIGTSAYVWWEHKVTAEQEAIGDKYFDAILTLDKKGNEEGLKAFTSVANTPTTLDKSYAAIAPFKRISLLITEGKTEQAIAELKSLKDRKLPKELSYLAKTLYLSHLIARGRKEDNPLIEAGYAELQDQKENPWYYHVLELGAIVKLSQGQEAEAVVRLQSLARANEAPEGVKLRSQELLDAIYIAKPGFKLPAGAKGNAS